MSPDLVAKLNTLLQAAETTNLTQNIRAVFALLQEAGHMYSMTIPSKQIGIHPNNRDGYGANPHDVHDLLQSIASVG